MTRDLQDDFFDFMPPLAVLALIGVFTFIYHWASGSFGDNNMGIALIVCGSLVAIVGLIVAGIVLYPFVEAHAKKAQEAGKVESVK